METPKFTNSEIQRECKGYSEKIQSMHDRLSEMVVGRQARIISSGEIITVEEIMVDTDYCQLWDGDYDHCYLRMDEVEFLDS